MVPRLIQSDQWTRLLIRLSFSSLKIVTETNLKLVSVTIFKDLKLNLI